MYKNEIVEKLMGDLAILAGTRDSILGEIAGLATLREDLRSKGVPND